ncbi:MAG: hypothetical protein EOP56_19585, partial [Sphingobacteriales bacterium]
MRSSTKRWARRSTWLAFAAAALLLSPAAQAQISGTKTVCASGCDYSSIGKAVSDLKSKGVNGKTTIEISAGAYNESVSIGGISGLSATNTLTFKGMGKVPTDTRVYNTASYVIQLSSTSYIILDNLFIDQQTLGSSNYGVDVYGSKNCTIQNCWVWAPASNTYMYGCAATRSGGSTDILWKKNYLRGGGYMVCDEGYSNGSNTRSIYDGNTITKPYYYMIMAQNSVDNQIINNYLDSGQQTSGQGLYSYYENNVKINNNYFGPVNAYYGMGFLYASAKMEVTNNMVLFGSSTQYGVYLYPYSSSAVVKFQHNTIHSSNSNSYLVYMYNANKGTIDFRNNNLTRSGSGITLYSYGVTANDMFEGNNFYNSGGTLLYWNGTAYSSLAAYKAVAKTFGMGQSDQNMAVTYKTTPTRAQDLHVDQSSLTPFAKNIGVNLDIDGDARCKYFVTSGADESTYSGNPHYAKPSSPNFTAPSIAYDGNPTVFFNAAKSSGGLDPVFYHWYVNGKWVSDSIHLETVTLSGPTSKVKLVAENCGGKDSVEKTITVTDPPAAPVSDFISDKNIIKQGDVIKFSDLSVNYPSSWKWEITPVNTFANGQSNPSYTITYGSMSLPNFSARFNYSGKYKVCLTASNKKGAGNQECKTDYITVDPAINMPTSGTVTITDKAGYLYDNGGPNKNPTGNYVQNKAVIAGCADSVYLIFTKFDLACGMDYIRLFEGKDASGKSLNKCSANSYVGSNFGGVTGYTGGPSSSSTGCAYVTAPGCIPAITDTFKASKSMYIEMGIYGYTSTPGFEAYYW